jgi:ribosomal protein S20
LQVAYKELDKAVTKGVLKKNTVSRKKSRLTLKVNALTD